jgi:hypothetical protein
MLGQAQFNDNGEEFGTVYNQPHSGSSSAVERQLPKLDVAGSIPVSRSNASYGPILASQSRALYQS